MSSVFYQLSLPNLQFGSSHLLILSEPPVPILFLPPVRLSPPAEVECQRTLQNQTLHWYETVVDTPHPLRPFFLFHQNHRFVGYSSVSSKNTHFSSLFVPHGEHLIAAITHIRRFSLPNKHFLLTLLSLAWNLDRKQDRMAPVLGL